MKQKSLSDRFDTEKPLMVNSINQIFNSDYDPPEPFNFGKPISISYFPFVIRFNRDIEIVKMYENTFESRTQGDFVDIVHWNLGNLESDCVIEFDNDIIIIEAKAPGVNSNINYNSSRCFLEVQKKDRKKKVHQFVRHFLLRDLLERTTGKSTHYVIMSLRADVFPMMDMDETVIKMKDINEKVLYQFDNNCGSIQKDLDKLNEMLFIEQFKGISIDNCYHVVVNTLFNSIVGKRKVIPTLNGINRAENDDEIINEHLVINHIKGSVNKVVTNITVIQIGWDGHKPYLYEEKVPSIHINSFSKENLSKKILALLNDPNYFGLCEICGQRNVNGHMLNDVLCQSCATESFGVIY